MTSIMFVAMALALLAQLLGLAGAWRQLRNLQGQVDLHTGDTKRHTQRSERRGVAAVAAGVGGDL